MDIFLTKREMKEEVARETRITVTAEFPALRPERRSSLITLLLPRANKADFCLARSQRAFQKNANKRP